MGVQRAPADSQPPGGSDDGMSTQQFTCAGDRLRGHDRRPAWGVARRSGYAKMTASHTWPGVSGQSPEHLEDKLSAWLSGVEFILDCYDPDTRAFQIRHEQYKLGQ